jgi:hypothetical protein
MSELAKDLGGWIGAIGALILIFAPAVAFVVSVILYVVFLIV